MADDQRYDRKEGLRIIYALDSIKKSTYLLAFFMLDPDNNPYSEVAKLHV
jgi:hypothetical protein